MTRDELQKALPHYTIQTASKGTYVKYEDDVILAYISETQTGQMDTVGRYPIAPYAFEQVYQYAQTPLKDRRPRYHWTARNYEYDDVLNVSDDEWFMDTTKQTNVYQTEFTKEEYSQLVESGLIPDWFDPRAI